MREEAVRFALYWYLYRWNDNKAASWCFEYIKDNKDAQAPFPGVPLYRRLNGTDWSERCAYSLISPDEFEHRCVARKPRNGGLTQSQATFGNRTTSCGLTQEMRHRKHIRYRILLET